MASLKCSLCNFEAGTLQLLVEHLTSKNHRFHPYFRVTCSVPGCGTTYQNWNSFKSHVKRKHRDTVAVAEDADEAQNQIAVQDRQGVQVGGGVQPVVPVPYDAKRSTASLILNIRERGRISHVATSTIADVFHGYLMKTINSLKHAIAWDLRQDPELLQEVHRRFDRITEDVNLIQHFKSAKNIQNFVTSHCGFLPPRKIIMGRNWKWVAGQQGPQLKESVHFGYVIPFLQALENMLNNKQIFYFVVNFRDYSSNDPNVFANYQDGEYVKFCPLYNDETSVIVIIYVTHDDMEVVNPLGSNTSKHKLSMFYWGLGNIPPHLRSSLRAMNLLGIVKTELLRRFGEAEMLKDFIEAIQLLERPEGVMFNINGQQVKVRGKLIFVSGDTPASNYLAGTKEGVGFAFMPCRSCLITRPEMDKKFTEEEFIMRDKATHEQHVRTIEDPTLNKREKSFWSRIYGINKRSLFSVLTYFDVTKCFPHDPMHIIHEGVLEQEMRYLLLHYVDSGEVTLQDINEGIEQFPFKENKPSLIDLAHLHNHLRQSASKMIQLAYALPFILYSIVDHDDERLLLFIMLLKIVNICMSLKLTRANLNELRFLVKLHHRTFIRLYPWVNFVPKFHYLIHLAIQIINLSPCRHHWCMRGEGFHLQFKELAKIIRNFKNIAYSLSIRYQMKELAYMDCNNCDSIVLFSNDVATSGESMLISSFKYRRVILNFIPQSAPNDQITVFDKIIYRGCTLKTGDAILLECQEDEDPIFGHVCYGIVHNTSTYVQVFRLETVCFVEALNSYKIKQIRPYQYSLIKVEEIIHLQQLPIIHLQDSLYTMLKYYPRAEYS